MPLRLSITSYHKITPGQCSEMTLDSGVLNIGRAQNNDWVLPDPERLISSSHCTIQSRDGTYFLTDNSTNGVEFVTSSIRLRRGNSERINDGEVIRIGDYEMLATLDDRLKIDVTNATPSNEAVSFEALMGAQAQPAPAVRVPPQFEHAAASDTLPDLFDFLAPAPVAPVTQPDHVPAQQHDFRAPTPPTAQPAGDAPAPMIPEDWDLPGIAQPALPAPVEAPAPAASAPAPTANDDLMQAFLRGAGLDHLRIDTAQAAAQMGSLGRSYRLMVEGLIDVLRARASLKGEFRMQQTLIQPLENNPLKFAPNADEALLLLLRHGNQAFMAPDQAIADSFEDLRAHQLAVMAGVQAAIGHLLKRFEPAALEARLDSPGGLAALLAGSRQARYWQQFTELYQQIANEAEDDFQDLFGREFSRAYEEHISRLRRP
ncbi:type VI secretion system-associated FHA domain protein TagH [Pseudomonas sp. TE3610]